MNPALLKPSAATEKAPATFKIKFTTTKGEFVVEVTRAWAPLGADRIYNLVKLGFFTDIACFRVVENFRGSVRHPRQFRTWRRRGSRPRSRMIRRARSPTRRAR